jgi:spermidine/putrescine transport system substrate-binding protein
VVEAYGLRVETARLGDELHLFTWPDYMDPQLLDDFEETYGVHVSVDYYDNNEALIAKLKAGGVGQYDLIVGSDYAVEILRRDGLLLPLDKEGVPNLKNLDPRFTDLPFDPGNRYSVAYQWGTSGLGVRTDLVEDRSRPLDTWKLVFDPASAVGPFAMMDDPRETIGAALIYLGYSVNATDPRQLAAAESLLVRQKPRVVTYAPFATARDLLASGDLVVAHNFSGDVRMARAEVPGLRFEIPREGAILWTDNLAVPKGAPHRYAAAVFINFLLDAEVGARLSNFTRYASPNAAALPKIDPALRADRSIYPDSATMARLQILRDVGPARALYDRIWTRLRASGG